MYQAYGLLQPTSNFTLDEAATRLRGKFTGYTVTRGSEQITVAKDDWEIELRLNADPAVQAESADIAEKIAGTVDGTEIAACARRVEVWSETPDPMMEHFSEFTQVIEVLQSFQGLIAVDPREPALM
jgi:hypothetical protein